MMIPQGRRQFLRCLGLGVLTAAVTINTAQGQTVSLDLRALFLSRLDELIKLAEKPPAPPGVTLSFPTASLKEAQKAFEAGQLEEVDKNLNAFGMALQGLRLAAPSGLPFSIPLIAETLRMAFYKVIDARILFSERTQQGKQVKLYAGLYTGGDKEEIFSPFLNECPKELKFTIQGKEVVFKLKECQGI